MGDARRPQNPVHGSTSPSLTGVTRAPGHEGFILVETLMATLLLGTVVLVFLTALATGSRSVEVTNTSIELSRLAQSQMEVTLSGPYLVAPVTYPSIPAPSAYAVTAVAEAIQGTAPDIQRVIVSVYHDGELRRTLEAFKFSQ